VLGSSDVVAFVNVTDRERALAFYQGTLGLKLSDDSPYALVFEVNGRMLRAAVNETVSPPPGTVLGWDVTDIAATIDALVSAGVEMARFDGMPQDERGIWDTPDGSKVAWFRDPDSNVLSLTQFAR
jgi:predicted enzyme related to lactoylglutathione lyase